MRTLARLAASATAILLLLTAQAALACPPPLPPPPPEPGESSAAYAQRLATLDAEKKRKFEAYLLEQQTGFWQQADTVIVARIEQVSILPGNEWSPLRKATLVPVAWLKGPKQTNRFALQETGSTDCGNFGGGDAPRGKPGDLIIVYSRHGKPGNKTMIGAIGQPVIRDPRVLEGLK